MAGLRYSRRTMPTSSEIAARLVHAYRAHDRLNATGTTAPAGVEAAYAAQHLVWHSLVGEQRPQAWKVGAQTRETSPFAAAIFPSRVVVSPARFARADFFTLGVEAEIALCFGRDLAADATRTDILDAIASVHVAMEMVDSRLIDAEAAGPLWRLADNLLNGGLVLGEAITNWREVDFSRCVVRVLADGQPIAESMGRPPLDDLFHCLPWWLRHVGGARAGDIVTTGAWSGAHPIGLPARAGVEFLGLGGVEAVVR